MHTNCDSKLLVHINLILRKMTCVRFNMSYVSVFNTSHFTPLSKIKEYLLFTNTHHGYVDVFYNQVLL